MNDIAVSAGGADFLEARGDFHFLAYPAHLLVATLDAQGLCDFVSPSWGEFTGRDVALEMGQGWLDRVHPDDQPLVLQGFQRARQSRESFRLLYRYLRADGAFRWFVNQGMPRNTPTAGFSGHICMCFDVTSYEHGESEGEQSARQLITLLHQTRLIGVALDVHGRIQFSNGGLCRLLNYNAIELMDCRLFHDHLSERDRPVLQDLYPHGVLSTNFPAEFESELVGRDGSFHRISWHAMVLREFSGRVMSTVLIGDDITDLRREEEQLALSAKIFESTDHAILVTNLGGKIVAVNHAFTLLTGYSREDVLGNNPRMLQSGRQDAAFYQQLWTGLLKTGHWSGDIWNRRKDGTIYPEYLSISTIKNEPGTVTHFAGIFYDISERKNVEDRLDRLAHYDALTGLANRSLLLSRLELAMAQATRDGGKLALLYLDLDHFKKVNDELGHAMGDAVLVQAAQRMKACGRAVDTVARMGGDEFVVLLPQIREIGDATGVATKLLEALMPPYDLEGRQVRATPSIGISVFPGDGTTMETLLKNADMAMYQAKQAGRARVGLFQAAAGG